MDSRFPETSAPTIRLLQGAIYAEDTRLWKLLLDHRDEITKLFHDLGTTLVVDTAEGYAYIEQMSLDADEGIPQLFRRRALSFEVTMLLVILREELLRFDSTPSGNAAAPTVEEGWLIEQMASFVAERKNQVKRKGFIEQVIRTAVTMGVLKELSRTKEHATYQIMRIVKAKLPQEKLADVRAKLKEPATEDPNHVE